MGGGNTALEDHACGLIRRALDACLGTAPTRIVALGPAEAARKSSAARSLGSTGRVFRIERTGWGMAFERTAQIAFVVLDLSSDPEEMVSPTLHRMRAIIAQQAGRRGRAAALGITAPLEGDTFSDPPRLRIDVAAAVALLEELGSEQAVLGWL